MVDNRRTVEHLASIGTIDLLVGLPGKAQGYWDERIKRRIMAEDPAYERHLAPYLYKEPPAPYRASLEEATDALFERMDRYGIERVLVAVDEADTDLRRLVEKHPEQLLVQLNVDPNEGMRAVRSIEQGVRDLGARAVTILPCAYWPPVPIDDRKLYPIYAKCAELGIPAFISVGVPGPRVPLNEQRVDRIDEVCWFFPELTVILRHGGLPWIDLALQLVLKWPNLYYSTSALAPEYYPDALLRFMNTRGREKVMFSGYYPFGLDYDRVFGALCRLDIRDEVLPLFLHENARRVMGLDNDRPVQ